MQEIMLERWETIGNERASYVCRRSSDREWVGRNDQLTGPELGDPVSLDVFSVSRIFLNIVQESFEIHAFQSDRLLQQLQA